MLNLFKFKKAQQQNFSFIFAIVISIFLLICDVFDFSFISIIKTKLVGHTLNIKCFANKIIEFPQILAEYMHIKKENSALKMQIDDLKTKINALQNTEFELKELKQSIGLKYSFSNYKYMEKVLGFDKSPYESFMIISKTSPMTTAGKIVISSDGLVGVITNYNNKIAFVMTVCDQKLSIPAKTEKERLIISGIYKNKMELKEIRKNIASTKLNLSLGEILYTSGEGGFFPANIPIAKITGIHQDSNSISAVPLSSIADISYVWIISPVSD